MRYAREPEHGTVRTRIVFAWRPMRTTPAPHMKVWLERVRVQEQYLDFGSGMRNWHVLTIAPA